MSAENNKAIVSRYLDEVWNNRELEVANELVAPSYEPIPGAQRGAEGAKALVHFFLSAFPDFVVRVRDLVAEGDCVVVRYEFTGTHRGSWMGVNPTERHIAIEGITLYRLTQERVVATHFAYDALGLLHQLGASALPSLS